MGIFSARVLLFILLVALAPLRAHPSSPSVSSLAAPAGQTQPQPVASARFEQGGSWTVSTAVTLTVGFNATVLLASWQWLGANGQPVSWQGAHLPPVELKPANNTW